MTNAKNLYNAFLQAQQGTETNKKATILLIGLDAKRKVRCLETVNSINFTHFSRLAWNKINKFTGRSRYSHWKCPFLINAIASQLVMNEAHRTSDREFSRLVGMEICDLQTVPTSNPDNISSSLFDEEFLATLQYLNPMFILKELVTNQLATKKLLQNS